ncbi:hypothetical protein AMS68_000189 [Peltaster fructicola]|uniref:CID domain-containing protein n=1 Tax=Peltaster fructicola TaxID=286661 RepID=A0A6H0XIX8_9PEZI|nr:hypothetical protein AMS68_000189 [Peltaster fructicola]
MAYNDNAVTDKLSSLNESQDSIVAVAQWIMFWRRHASRTAQLWLTRLQDAPTLKRLNLIYLANEVVQQSRARGKTDFLLAFEPIISDATAIAYKGASMEVQQKLKRVVDVWRQRNIFEQGTQTSIEKRVEEIDRLRGGGGGSNGIGSKGKLGGSLFGGSGGSVAPELEDVSQALTAVSRAEVAIQTAVPGAEAEYSKMMDAGAAVPTPPVHAARLNTLLKSLASAQSAVEGCIKAREDIVAGLEKLLEKHRAKLITDEQQAADITSRRGDVETKKKEVEDHIMQGLSTQDAIAPAEDMETADPARPEPESFTPPPPDVEAFTPPPQADEGVDTAIIGDANVDEQLLSGPTGADNIQEQPTNFNEPSPSTEPPLGPLGQTRSASGEVSRPTEDPRLKRRKMSHQKAEDLDEAIFGAGSLGVDEERISALLGN